MRRWTILGALSLIGTGLVPAHADTGETPPPDPAPGSADWNARDAQNMNHAMARLTQDQYGNPAYQRERNENLPETYGTNVHRQASDPTHPIVTLAQLIPGATNADPFRTEWEEQGRGVRYEFTFLNRYGAKLR